jgi:hypothetical protein
MILLAELLISCTWMTAFVRAAFSTIAPVSSVCSGERWAESCQPVGPFCFSCECIHEIRSRSKTKATRRSPSGELWHIQQMQFSINYMVYFF